MGAGKLRAMRVIETRNADAPDVGEKLRADVVPGHAPVTAMFQI